MEAGAAGDALSAARQLAAGLLGRDAWALVWTGERCLTGTTITDLPVYTDDPELRALIAEEITRPLRLDHYALAAKIRSVYPLVAECVNANLPVRLRARCFPNAHDALGVELMIKPPAPQAIRCALGVDTRSRAVVDDQPYDAQHLAAMTEAFHNETRFALEGRERAQRLA